MIEQYVRHINTLGKRGSCVSFHKYTLYFHADLIRSMDLVEFTHVRIGIDTEQFRVYFNLEKEGKELLKITLFTCSGYGRGLSSRGLYSAYPWLWSGKSYTLDAKKVESGDEGFPHYQFFVTIKEEVADD